MSARVGDVGPALSAASVRSSVPSGAGRRSAGTVAAAACSAALGFALVAAFGMRATPWPADFPIAPKLEHLAEEGGRYDAVFVGSSNVFRSFVPVVIDARLEANGVPLRTFNLGGPSLYSFEADFVLRRLLALDSVDLDYVFMEPGDWDAEPKVAEDLTNMLSDRSVFWHDLRQTSNVLRSIARSDAPFGRKLFLAREHVHAFLWKLTSYGQGARTWKHFAGVPAEQPITAERIAKAQGYQALEELSGPVMAARRRLLTQDLPGFREKIAAIEPGNAQPLAADAFCRDAIAEQVECIRAAGAEPIYVVGPASHETHWAWRLNEEGAIRLLGFNRPKLYPELYAAERHFDPNHLDRVGAGRFSRLFGDVLAGYLEEELGR